MRSILNYPNSSLPQLLLVSLIVLSISFSCKQTSSTDQSSKTQNSNEKMLAILADVAKKLDNPKNTYAEKAKLKECDAQIAAAQSPEQKMQLAFKKAMILLEYGDEQQAVTLFEQLYKAVVNLPKPRIGALNALGMAYMRLGERSNCFNNHGSDACIMPIKGNGIYHDKGPTGMAIQAFQAALKEEPDNYDAMWLLNIAYMTINEYPKGVPKGWLIPGLDAPGSNPVKPFTDIAPDLKLDIKNRAGGLIIDDFNNDGYLDIVNSAWGMDDPMHFFRNNANGTFTDVSGASGLSNFTGGLNMMQADYNNDGWMDILVLRGAWQGQAGFGDQPNSLFKNNGDGTFTDVTIDAGLLTYHPTQAATWNDFNNDGWIDLFIGNETTDPATPHSCEVYINNQNGAFKNVTIDAHCDINKFIKGVTSGDFDNDGWPDVFLSSLDGRKTLLRNKGIPGPGVDFEDVTGKAGLSNDLGATFPTGFFDYDNDGWLDLMMCNYDFDKALSYYSAKEILHPSSDRSGKVSLYHNNRNGTFSNVSVAAGFTQTVFGMAANFGDIDNDGYLDLYFATGNPSYKSIIPNKLFRNIGGKRFADVTVSARVGNIQKGHGVSFADLNNNGDQDIIVDLGGAYRGDAYHTSVYLNPGQNTNNWICLQLEGTKSNRAAIGAKVTVKFTENGVKRMVYRIVNSGASFGASPLRRQIGIGKATTIDEIIIEWPSSGITQTLRNIQPNKFIKITEGKDGFEPSPIKTLIFRKADGSIPMCAPPPIP